MPFRSTKTFGHDLGLSATFRQWRATSHCRFLHGYALAVKMTFEGSLDENGWVADFGGFKAVKEYLQSMFDHKTLVAKDDPQLEEYRKAHTLGWIDLVEVERTGCEAFACMIYWKLDDHRLANDSAWPSAKCVEVEVSEHGANSAIFSRLYL